MSRSSGATSTAVLSEFESVVTTSVIYISRRDPEISNMNTTGVTNESTVVQSSLLQSATAFLICSGPSLKGVDLSCLHLRGILTCAVKNAGTLLRSNLWSIWKFMQYKRFNMYSDNYFSRWRQLKVPGWLSQISGRSPLIWHYHDLATIRITG